MTAANSVNAGSEIDSRCGKCKDTTNHTVIALTAGRVAKVECRVCGSRHNYRPPEGTVKKSGSRVVKKGESRSTAAAVRVSKEEARFEELLAGRDPEEGAPYSMTGSFEANQILAHPTFGPGVVVRLIAPNLMEVQFRAGSKTLVRAAG